MAVWQCVVCTNKHGRSRCLSILFLIERRLDDKYSSGFKFFLESDDETSSIFELVKEFPVTLYHTEIKNILFENIQARNIQIRICVM